MQICVFCSSSDAIDRRYVAVARRLGEQMARRGHGLVYGGGSVGLMGVIARSVHRSGGRVLGVIPESLRDLELAYEEADELVITATLHERKQRMEDAAGGFIALPGGIGTLEEMLEVIALKQLRYHTKPIVWLDAEGYFDPILEQLGRSIDERFARPSLRTLYTVARSPDEALDYLEDYRPPAVLEAPYIPPPSGELLETLD